MLNNFIAFFIDNPHASPVDFSSTKNRNTVIEIVPESFFVAKLEDISTDFITVE